MALDKFNQFKFKVLLVPTQNRPQHFSKLWCIS